jgi:hypothetical protein
MKANQKATGSAEDDKREFLSTFYKSDSLDLIQPKWSEALTTRELEENIDAIGMTVLIQMLELILREALTLLCLNDSVKNIIQTFI